MKKKFYVLLIYIIILSIISACGGNSNENDLTYTLSEFSLVNAEYGDFYKFDTKDIKVLDGSGNVTDKTVSISSIKWPDGRVTKLASSSMKLNIAGEYILTYIIKGMDNSPEFTKILICKDTQGPIITLGEEIFIPKTAIIGQDVVLPVASGTDLSGLKGDIICSVKDEVGNEIPINSGTFKTVSEGVYKIKYSAKDNNNNENSFEIELQVYKYHTESDIVGYMHTPYGIQQNDGMYRHEAYIKEYYIEDVTHNFSVIEGDFSVNAGEIANLPDGTKAATLITPSADRMRVTYCINSVITDFTGYDYVGMWIYNESSRVVRASLNYRSGNEYTLEPGKWNYIAFNLNNYDYLSSSFCAYNDTGSPVLQSKHLLRQITLRFDYEWYENEFDSTDSYGYELKGYASKGFNLYMGCMKAGEFSDGYLMELDKTYGSAFFTNYTPQEFPVVSELFFEYVTDIKQEGTNGSTLFKTKSESEKANIKLYMVNENDTVLEETFYGLWVKNGNDFAIVFDDGLGNVTTLNANEEKIVNIKLSSCNVLEWQGYGLYGADITRADGDNLPAGTNIYIGALKTII